MENINFNEWQQRWDKNYINNYANNLGKDKVGFTPLFFYLKKYVL